MSRIGQQPVILPQSVRTELTERSVVVEGTLGRLTVAIPLEIAVQKEGEALRVSVLKKTRRSGALWGLTRALLANAVKGVSQGFSQRLIIEGIGYRAALEGETLVLSLGFSHSVRVDPPEGIQFHLDKNVIAVSGYDKQLVGNVSASIRELRKPEPYKGKGIRREHEVIRRKAGKKAATAK